jgi:hypothetical protein
MEIEVSYIVKAAVAASFVAVLVCLALSWKNAKRLAVHKKWTTFSVVGTLVAVGLTEAMVQFSIATDPRSTLFWVHMCFALPFLVLLLVLRFWMTGVHNVKVHRPMGIGVMALYGGTFLTGMTLLFS